MGHGHDHKQGHDHGHDHAIEAGGGHARKLWIALGLTVGFMGVEVVAGFAAHSLALLSDAGHMLTDAGALALALIAQRIAEKPRTRLFTFGFRRAEIVAALLNGIILALSAVWVIVEAVRRFADPPHIDGGWMLVVATVGLLVNLVSAWVLGSGSGDNANVRAAFLHVLSDAAGSVAAIVAGVFIVTVGWTRADPVVSVLISLLILWGAYRLLRDSVHVLMETSPAGVDIEKVERTIRATPGVADLHDLHVWAISQGFPVVTVHVLLDGDAHGTDVARDVGARLREAHGITHVTVQPEAPAHDIVPTSRLSSRRSAAS